MKTFVKTVIVMFAIVLGTTFKSNAQMVDGCNNTGCDLKITAVFEPGCAAANGCIASFTFTIPAFKCPFPVPSPCPCPIVAYTITDGTNTYTVGEPAFGYPGWDAIGIILCGGTYNIHGGPAHIHIH